MMQTKLTKRAVDATKPGSRDFFLWDTELTNFGLKVTPTGRRVFIVQYWAALRHRIRRRVTLGSFGALTVEMADMSHLVSVEAGAA